MKNVMVLEIGSSKISCMVGSSGVNNTINISGISEVPYSGYLGGKFFEEEKLPEVVETAVSTALDKSQQSKIKNVYVGIPSEFSLVLTRNVFINFNKKCKVNEKHLFNLFELAENQSQENGYTVTNRSAIEFTLDDGRKVLDPIGLTTNKLSANVSIILVEDKILNTFTKILKDLDFSVIEFINESLCLALHQLDKTARNEGAIIIDVGHICTSVALVKGDGVAELKTFSMGGGHITGDLQQCLGKSFAVSELLKRNIILSLNHNSSELYKISHNNVAYVFPAKISNEIVLSRIDMMAGKINECISRMKSDYVFSSKIYLAGGGLVSIKGAKDYLSKILGRNIKAISSKHFTLSKPQYAVILGLLDIAIKENI